MADWLCGLAVERRTRLRNVGGREVGGAIQCDPARKREPGRQRTDDVDDQLIVGHPAPSPHHGHVRRIGALPQHLRETVR